jgi:hypothetical protein
MILQSRYYAAGLQMVAHSGDSQMKWRNAFRRTSIILTLYAMGLLEAYYLPRYGLEWLLAAVGATVLLASFWIRSHWD